MLSRGELRRWIDRFRVPESQVRRDHLISHLLVALGDLIPDATFFGGTALCRTHLPDWRLSEDIDLLVDEPGRTSDALDETIFPLLRREYPAMRLTWGSEPSGRVAVAAADDLRVRLQLVERDASYSRYPVARMPVRLRYDDVLKAVELLCPTATSAAAMKLNAWMDRAAPRDLCDLYGLARVGALTREALDLAALVSRPVQRQSFSGERLPSEEAWLAALGHQMAEVPEREEALGLVGTTVARAAGW